MLGCLVTLLTFLIPPGSGVRCRLGSVRPEPSQSGVRLFYYPWSSVESLCNVPKLLEIFIAVVVAGLSWHSGWAIESFIGYWLIPCFDTGRHNLKCYPCFHSLSLNWNPLNLPSGSSWSVGPIFIGELQANASESLSWEMSLSGPVYWCCCVSCPSVLGFHVTLWCIQAFLLNSLLELTCSSVLDPKILRFSYILSMFGVVLLRPVLCVWCNLLSLNSEISSHY